MHPSRLFSLQQKAPVKSAAGLGPGTTLFSVINGQSVISKFGRPFILDSFSPETASRFRSEIRLTFVRSDFATRSGGNRRFRKASESVPRSRSGKCPCSYCSYFCMTSSHQDLRGTSHPPFPAKMRKMRLGFPPRRPFARPLGCVTNPETLSRRVRLVFGIIAPRSLGRPPPHSRTPARTPSPARSSPPPRANRVRHSRPRHPREASHPS